MSDTAGSRGAGEGASSTRAHRGLGLRCRSARTNCPSTSCSFLISRSITQPLGATTVGSVSQSRRNEQAVVCPVQLRRGERDQSLAHPPNSRRQALPARVPRLDVETRAPPAGAAHTHEVCQCRCVTHDLPPAPARNGTHSRSLIESFFRNVSASLLSTLTGLGSTRRSLAFPMAPTPFGL